MPRMSDTWMYLSVLMNYKPHTEVRFFTQQYEQPLNQFYPLLLIYIIEFLIGFTQGLQFSINIDCLLFFLGGMYC